MVKKMILVTLLVGVLLGNFAEAASQDDWDIYYMSGAPSNVSVQVNQLYVAYDSDGYYSYCTSISGGNDRYLTINSTDAGGMSERMVTTTGKSSVWKMNGSINMDVEFKVRGVSSSTVYSKGYIHINN